METPTRSNWFRICFSNACADFGRACGLAGFIALSRICLAHHEVAEPRRGCGRTRSQPSWLNARFALAFSEALGDCTRPASFSRRILFCRDNRPPTPSRDKGRGAIFFGGRGVHIGGLANEYARPQFAGA